MVEHVIWVFFVDFEVENALYRPDRLWCPEKNDPLRRKKLNQLLLKAEKKIEASGRQVKCKPTIRRIWGISGTIEE